ncbi:MAG TPA: ABC transporter ATP-binding protein, partial [Burkholderiales bacterium]|nr:ABC transporter ATP-binding protein [Burkholderiales bacterium]
MMVAMAHLVKYGFNHFIRSGQHHHAGDLVRVALGLAAAAAAIAWLRYRERVDAERMGQDYAAEIRIVIYDHLAALPPRVLQRRSHGGMAMRFVGDLVSLRRWVSLGLARLTVASIVTGGTLLALAFLDWTLSLSIGIVLLSGAAATMTLGRRLKSATEESRKRLTRIAANVNEKIATMAVVQIFGQMSRERKRLVRQGRNLQYAMVERARVAGEIAAVSEITSVLATAMVLLLGTMEVSSGRASSGTIVAAMAIISLLVQPLRDMSRIQEYRSGFKVSLHKIQQFLDTPSTVQEMPGAPPLEIAAGSIEFDNVTVGGALKGVTAAAEAGSVVAIVGPNGAGKSTLLMLAARLLDPEDGCVRIDGQQLQQHNLASIRKSIGMVGADLPLLRGTIEMNLRYRWPDAPDEEVARVCRLCGIDELLLELPKGDQTRIAEGGLGLSAGQRQRISLARALLGSPRLLLLDEADSNLDPQAASVIDRVLKD